MISTVTYTGDGATRVFPVAFEIQGENYVVVFIDDVAVNDRTTYDIINNSIVFVEESAPATDSIIEIVVASSPTEIADLNAPPSTVQTIIDNLADINSVANTVVPNIAEILLADDNATIATTKALEASTSAGEALANKNLAVTSAGNALVSEQSADASEAQALSYKNSAEASATTATTKAGEASTKAGEASTSASQALGYRNEAEAFSLSKAFVVDTIEALTTIPSSYTTAIVKDLNRGGTFVWSETGTANGGTVFAGATGYWNRQYSGAVNVKWFGAVGDGVTDDTVAIQSAINNSSVLNVPDGIYLVGISSILTIQSRNNFLLYGSGTIKLCNNSQILSSSAVLIILNSVDITISGITIDGNNANNTSDTMSTTGLVTAIKVDECTNVNIINNRIINSNNNGIYFSSNNKACLASNNYTENCFGSDIRVGENSVALISGNICKLTKDIHTGVKKQDGFIAIKYGGSATVSNNELFIDSSVAQVPAMFIWVSGVVHCSIAGNSIVTASAGVSFGIQSDLLISANSINIVDNLIYNCDQGITIQSSIALINVSRCAISNNSIYASTQSGIGCASSVTFDKLNISQNMIEFSNGYGITAYTIGANICNNVIKRIAGSHCIFSQGTNHTINNNTLFGGAGVNRGIELYSPNSVVNGNVCTNFAGTSIREQTGGNYNIITSNNCKGSTITIVGVNTINANNIVS